MLAPRFKLAPNSRGDKFTHEAFGRHVPHDPRIVIPGGYLDGEAEDSTPEMPWDDIRGISADEFAADFADSFDALARQPIVDAGGEVRGYELLYRGLGEVDACHMRSGMHATSEVLCTAAFNLGLEQAGDNGKPLYVNVDGPTLMSAVVEAIDPRIGVIELLESVIITTAIQARVEELHARGYRFALDDVSSPRDERLSLLHCVDVVKVDMQLATRRDAITLLSLAHVHDKLALAEKLEDEASLADAKALGFDLFQGYQTGVPLPIACLRLPACSPRSIHCAYRLARNVTVSTQSLAIIVAGDPALALRLWLLADFYAGGSPMEVSSVRELIAAVPRQTLCAWLTALLLTAEDIAPRGGWHFGAIFQSRFMQLAARRAAPNDLALADSAYLLGLITHFRQTLAQVFREPIRQVRGVAAIENAASFRSGTLGALLDLALGMSLYPEGWCPESLKAHPGFQSSLSAIASEARRWARECCLADRRVGVPATTFGRRDYEMPVD